MICPYCKHSTEVVETRQVIGKSEVNRRRRCKNTRCKRIFTTVERAEVVVVGDRSRLSRMSAIRRAAKAVQQKGLDPA